MTCVKRGTVTFIAISKNYRAHACALNNTRWCKIELSLSVIFGRLWYIIDESYALLSTKIDAYRQRFFSTCAFCVSLRKANRSKAIRRSSFSFFFFCFAVKSRTEIYAIGPVSFHSSLFSLSITSYFIMNIFPTVDTGCQ